MAQRSNDLNFGMPVMPTGTEVASYQTYAEAQGAVDYLSDQEFDVKSITIVGTDLHLVERVTGRMTMGRAALSGASSGALWGAFMGLMLSFAAPNGSAFVWVGIGILGGALAGIIMSGLLYAMTSGRRDFTSQSQTRRRDTRYLRQRISIARSRCCRRRRVIRCVRSCVESAQNPPARPNTGRARTKSLVSVSA